MLKGTMLYMSFQYLKTECRIMGEQLKKRFSHFQS
jgi:hypothetical protein